MTASGLLILPGVRQLLCRVLPDGLQEPVADLVAAALGHDEGLVDELADELEPVRVTVPGAPADDPDGGVDVEAVGEHRQRAQRRLLGTGQQVVAPIQRGAQRLLAGRSRAGTAGQQREAVAEPSRYLSDAEHPQSSRGQLEGQRDALQPAADLGDDGRVVLRQGELRTRLTGTIAEQLDRLRGSHVSRRARRLVGHRKGRHRNRDLAGQPEQLPAGGEHPDALSVPQDGLDEGRDRVEDVLAVVEQQQRVTAGQVPADLLDRWRELRHGQPERSRHGRRGRRSRPAPVRARTARRRRRSRPARRRPPRARGGSCPHRPCR